jgi:uncharacterized protein
MPRVVHFEIIADNPDRAKKFWSEVFDWKIQDWGGPEPYSMINTGDEDMGINGCLAPRSEAFKDVDSVLVIGVSSIDETTKKIEATGGSLEVPKRAVGEMGWVAYYKAPGGLLFGVWESNPSFNPSE